jgi:transcriptional regulator with GAF, ATPase, and Fis domain
MAETDKQNITDGVPLEGHSWEGFSLQAELNAHEKQWIARALRDAGGSVTRAASLLGLKGHQTLAYMINGRHRELLVVRLPIRPRRKNLTQHPPRKQKGAAS